jgi:hypothetical protein
MKLYYLDTQPFAPNGHARYLHDTSGPFAQRAEAERAMREALGTGRFASVTLREKEVADEDAGEDTKGAQP